MGREIKRVPLDFDFPIGESYHDAQYDKHRETCHKSEDDCGDSDECQLAMAYEPPKGDGWQLWQTVSDGPTSPVFATAEALIEWMCQPVPVADRPRWAPQAYPDDPWAQGWRREIAEPFVHRCGWAPSFVISPTTGLTSGAEAVVMAEKERSR